MLIDLCPVCGSDVSHFTDADGNILLDDHGVSLWTCETPWLHPSEPKEASHETRGLAL